MNRVLAGVSKRAASVRIESKLSVATFTAPFFCGVTLIILGDAPSASSAGAKLTAHSANYS
jgi:hypothetical protein